MKLKNIVLVIKDQGPLKRFLHNLFKGNLKGIISEYSHINKSTGKLKVKYNTKTAATNAAAIMSKKTGKYFSNYKCLHCDGYHIGKNKGSNNWDPHDPKVKEVRKP